MSSSPKIKVLFLDRVHPLLPEGLERLGCRCDYFTGSGKPEDLPGLGEYAGLIVRSRYLIGRSLLDTAGSLRFIGRLGSGMENIDTEYAASKGIFCINSPEGNRDAVGEHATGMLLSLLNHLNRADSQVRRGAWLREENRGIEIKGKTVGIIGYGNTGSAFARCLKGFECEVISYDKYKSGYSDGNTRESTLEEIHEKADILSLHVPLTDETRYMVNDPFIRSVKKDFYLINTSRGPVVKTDDLVRHLRSGHVRGAALDVLEYEETSFDGLGKTIPPALKFLYEAENVILTPHIAGVTEESQVRMAEVLLEKIKKVIG